MNPKFWEGWEMAPPSPNTTGGHLWEIAPVPILQLLLKAKDQDKDVRHPRTRTRTRPSRPRTRTRTRSIIINTELNRRNNTCYC